MQFPGKWCWIAIGYPLDIPPASAVDEITVSMISRGQGEQWTSVDMQEFEILHF